MRKEKTLFSAKVLIPLVLIIVLAVFIFWNFYTPEMQRNDLVLKMTANISYSNTIPILSEGDSALPSNLSVVTYNIPSDFPTQEVLAIGISETYSLQTDKFGNVYKKLIFQEPMIGDNSYSLWAVVEVLPIEFEINPSSIGDIEGVLPEYREASAMIQSDSPSILLLAEEITKGSETEFDEAIDITRWVYNNISYDSAYINITKDALWTYENRVGVCTEYSHLTIALMRARGIPARIAYGAAPYDYPAGWLAHTWVEAYFNGTWYPFDPTWDLAGQLDATHIKMASLPDQSYVFINVSLSGIDIDLGSLEQSKLQVEIINSEEESPKLDWEILRKLA